MSLDSLKSVPCPAGQRCTAFLCIFMHEPIPVLEETLAADNDRPRKRLRTEETNRSKQPDLSKVTADAATLSQEACDGGDEGDRGQPNGPDDGSTLHLSALSNSVSQQSDTQSSVQPFPDEITVIASTTTAAQPERSEKPEKPEEPEKPEKLARPEKPEKPEKLERPEQPIKPVNTPLNVQLSPRPVKSNKTPYQIRFKLLKLLHEELVRLNGEATESAGEAKDVVLLSEQDLICRAVDEEAKTAGEHGLVYANVMKNRIQRYRKMPLQQWQASLLENVGVKKDTAKPSAVLNPLKYVESDLLPAREVIVLLRLKTPVSKLRQHGYVTVIPSSDELEQARRGVEVSDGWEKCDRCSGRFQVFPGRRIEDGALTSNGPCRYHYGRTSSSKRDWNDAFGPAKRFSCCGQEVGQSAGCTSSKHHVFKITDPKRLGTLLNFEETPENLQSLAHGAVSMDCEMAYTVYGLELVRLTALSWPHGDPLLDVLVRPFGEILDLNSRFSGVWPQDFAEAEPWSVDLDADSSTRALCLPLLPVPGVKSSFNIMPSPEVARKLLFSLLTPDMPLIGHGLENDLNATRIVHSTLVDSILLYPHRLGLPYRNSLKGLASTFLSLTIQKETKDAEQVGGHDSGEDARVAGALVRLKVFEEWKKMQRDGCKLKGGLKAPPELK